jgi:hypothetical protein
MEKETTLDTLARMVAEGFTAIDRRFDVVDVRFETMDARFDDADKRMESMNKTIQSTNDRISRVVMSELDDHAARIKDLEIAGA